jgi:hypothetical protein
MNMKSKYIEECKIIQQNCTYTAEAHHQVALSEKRKAAWLETVPAICAALTGTLVAAKYASGDLLFITVISAVMTAVVTVLSPRKNYEAHLAAAQNFTSIKHDARFMHEASSTRLSDEDFAIAVENLHNRYNDLLKAVPPTDPKSFEKARKIVQGKIHEPDQDAEGKIK